MKTAIGELARGVISDDTIGFIKSLDRPLDVCPSQKTVLYATNFNVWRHNKEQIHAMPGDLFVYEAEDKGSDKALSNIVANKV